MLGKGRTAYLGLHGKDARVVSHAKGEEVRVIAGSRTTSLTQYQDRLRSAFPVN